MKTLVFALFTAIALLSAGCAVVPTATTTTTTKVEKTADGNTQTTTTVTKERVTPLVVTAPAVVVCRGLWGEIVPCYYGPVYYPYYAPSGGFFIFHFGGGGHGHRGRR